MSIITAPADLVVREVQKWIAKNAGQLLREAHAEELRRQRAGLGPVGEAYFAELFIKQAVKALEPRNW